MALSATHLKFALELKDKYDVKNLAHYISGTLYPDSRYMTGISRELTHDDERLKAIKDKSDFQKGWEVHLICDHISHKIYFDVWKDLLKDPKDFDWWVILTALKMVQDIRMLNKFDIEKYLPLIKYVESPNGEPEDAMHFHYRTIVETYHDGVDIDDIKRLLSSTKIREDRAKGIVEKVREYLQDDKLLKNIDGVCDEIISLSKKLI